MDQANPRAQSLRQQIIDYGKPNSNDLVALSIKVIKSTEFFAPGAAISSKRMFTQSQTNDGFWNNHTFPLRETAMDVLGFRFTHNLSFLGDPVEVSQKIQQMFEETSFLKVKYRQRSERLNLNLSLLTPSSNLATGTTVTANTKGVSVHEGGFFLLPEKLQIGGQQDVEFLLDVQSGFTLSASLATTAAASPIIPNSTLGAGARGFFMSLEALVVEKGESAI